ncbi:MAG: N-acetylmuramoyl-L-alanine amidase [Gammaproteobacteria bacterium]|nr:N-acetylmuramoyl-L-alanine amidase [Gammaproteobacteria bacterium]
MTGPGPLPRIVLAMLLLLTAVPVSAAPVQVLGLRTWPAPDNTRVVLDLSAEARYRVFTIDNPERLVVDIKGARLDKASRLEVTAEDRLLKGIRSGVQDGTLRIVMDLQGEAQYKDFLLKPYRQYGHRLVIDLFTKTPSPAGPAVAAEAAPPLVIAKPSGMRDLVIAIDAGHGGEDPGALGYRGTREKDVVLAIARHLATLIDRERGMKAVLTRSGDYFLSLRKRTQIARDNKADLFVSIHADSFRDKRVKGTSVFVLSSHGATDEAARWLAEKENASDLIGGVSLDDKDDVLRSVLLDLSQTATLESSLEAADDVLRNLGSVGELHKGRVQQAGFVVLKSPDMPSMLIETAFISNPAEERKLRDVSTQRAMAEAMLGGIRNYFVKNAPPDSLFATRRHTILRGDRLSDLATQYQVSVEDIKQLNGLKDETLPVGRVLRIPAAREG